MSTPLYYGASWYPELWDEAVWRADIAAMRELRFNFVRMGDFIWSTVEPDEGVFDFSVLKQAADALHEAGIRFMLTTGTAAPPVWYTHGHPERCHRNERGVMSHGSRQHACINHPVFHQAIERMLSRYAKELGNHPGLVGWQIDNEINSHVGGCLCESCKTQWHEWLETRYGDIGALNRVWTTGIFSQTYQRFDQVPQPVTTPFQHNPSLQTAYRRFAMDSAKRYVNMQAAVIRRFSAAPVSTNGSIGFHLDHSALFQNLDFAMYTTYPSQENHAIYLMNHDYWRNMKPGNKHWLIETTCLHAGHLQNLPAPLPKGYLAAEAASAYALDSQSFVYWHLRQHRGGCEIGHSALLSAWGQKTAGWNEAQKAAEIKEKLEPLILRTQLKKPEVALFYSDIARAYFEAETLSQGSYTGWIRQLHKHVFHAGYPRDVITECSDWEPYRLVWTAFLPYLDTETLDKAERFMRSGGTWIVGPMTGHRTKEHGVPTDCALGEIERRFGFSTRFVAPLHGAVANVEGFSETPELAMWGFAFDKRGMKTLGTIHGGCMDGETFLAEMPVGDGKLVLLGATPVGETGEALLQWIAERYIGLSGILRRAIPSRGVELVQRENENGDTLIAINMDKDPGTVKWNGQTVPLRAYETKIIFDDTENTRQ